MSTSAYVLLLYYCWSFFSITPLLFHYMLFVGCLCYVLTTQFSHYMLSHSFATCCCVSLFHCCCMLLLSAVPESEDGH